MRSWKKLFIFSIIMVIIFTSCSNKSIESIPSDEDSEKVVVDYLSLFFSYETYQNLIPPEYYDFDGHISKEAKETMTENHEALYNAFFQYYDTRFQSDYDDFKANMEKFLHSSSPYNSIVHRQAVKDSTIQSIELIDSYETSDSETNIPFLYQEYSVSYSYDTIDGTVQLKDNVYFHVTNTEDGVKLKSMGYKYYASDGILSLIYKYQ